MKFLRHCILFCSLLLITSQIYGRWAPVPEREYNPEARETLIVHEWGTKLNVQGPKGTIHDGLYFKKERAVPDFVYRFSKNPPLTSGQMGIAIKPILYFYAKEPVSVRVKVVCNEGSWLEWYPRATHQDLLSREEKQAWLRTLTNEKQNSRLDYMNSLKPAFAHELSWWGEIIPPHHPDYKVYHDQLNQKLPEKGWYPITRQTDSALFRGRFEYPWTGEVEKFLFYRGSSATGPNLRVEFGKESSQLTIRPVGEHTGSQPLFYMETEGENTKIYPLSGETGEKIHLGHLKTLSPEEAKAMLSQIGQKAGLYEKEANGLAEIWSKDYFERPGRRLIYQIDPNALEMEQPLSITPKPKERVRFQLGWLELPTEEKVRHIQELVKKLPKNPSLLNDIQKEGFIAHPFMWELYHSSEDHKVKEQVLKYFHSEKNGI